MSVHSTGHFKYTRLLLAFILLLGTLSLFSNSQSAHAELRLNGFIIKDPLVPERDILRGGPPRDGIPPIDSPRFLRAEKADYLAPNDRVLGVEFKGLSKAYPVRILNYHEIVNDEFDGHPLTISFCPLCGTGMVFDGQYGKEKVNFGVSGLLYNSDLLMYDRQTDSLWSQIEGRAISGPAKGHSLKRLPVQHTTWIDWKKRHPDTLVLSTDTGHSRDYSNTPYPGYERSARTYFPVSHEDDRYHPKQPVIGIQLGQHAKVYPYSELEKLKGELKDKIGNQVVYIHYDAGSEHARILDAQGQELPALRAFWFAWMTFHPDSEVYQAPAMN